MSHRFLCGRENRSFISIEIKKYTYVYVYILLRCRLGFSGSSSGKEPIRLQWRRPWFESWVRKIP